ncbi:vesicle-associated membrane protein-associated protein B isoform X2 [Drosophila hydei]|uniref:Vesicle-associated membrane protein-associated protein B isoform X2 n=1 Tax=Drosophila hydei TaxID=7224 RepID=A0A6J2SQF7_DROHY|nr:vesicle-associated membrane protein-associated protein B isoform X2 [Drosophila hydei]XP_030079964.1 vesicle-associated membrane protein-associated protein B isoform X2 [Drosophila hydei]
MNKTAQFEAPLSIEPEHELRFVGPFNRPVVTIMTLKNKSVRTLVFKIKTTAPKRYCVRPNIGKIPSYRTTQVEICLQPFMYDQQEKNKHKFMVQSVLAPPDADLTDLNKLWKELEPEQLMDAKLKCVFEMPPIEANPENNSASGGVGGAGSASAGGSGGSNAPASLSSGEALKSDATVASTVMSSNLSDAEYAEALTAELRELRDLNGELRKENLHLKDQVTRYRSSPAAKQINEPYAPVLAEKQIPIFYIAIAIAAAFLGLLLGKFLL